MIHKIKIEIENNDYKVIFSSSLSSDVCLNIQWLFKKSGLCNVWMSLWKKICILFKT